MENVSFDVQDVPRTSHCRRYVGKVLGRSIGRFSETERKSNN